MHGQLSCHHDPQFRINLIFQKDEKGNEQQKNVYTMQMGNAYFIPYLCLDDIFMRKEIIQFLSRS